MISKLHVAYEMYLVSALMGVDKSVIDRETQTETMDWNREILLDFLVMMMPLSMAHWKTVSIRKNCDCHDDEYRPCLRYDMDTVDRLSITLAGSTVVSSWGRGRIDRILIGCLIFLVLFLLDLLFLMDRLVWSTVYHEASST